MPSSISALAVASPHANAVGAVRLTCEPHQLAIELVRLGGYSAGFLPGAVVESHTVRVPYTAIRGLVRRGRTLCLALDPAHATPHSRFALTRFSSAPPESLLFAYRARTWARALALALPLPLGAAAALLAPRSMAGGMLGLASLGAVVALAAHALLRELVRRVSWGGTPSDRARDAFEAEISRRLGLTAAVATRAGAPEPAELITASTATWVSVALASAALVGALAFVQRFTKPVNVPSRVAALTAGLTSHASAAVAALPRAPTPGSLPSCRCVRPDSPLWRTPLPSLSVLLIARDGGDAIAPSVDRHDAPRYDFDVAAVNNGRQTLRDVRIVITFAQRSTTGQRIRATDRGLYVEALASGRALKWRVRGPGTELRVDLPKLPPLRWRAGEDDPAGAVEAAPAEAFRALLSANQPRVRSHAAMMLAYLRHEGSRDAALELSGSEPSNERDRQAILRATAPIMACAITPRDGAFSACITNESDQASSGILREITANDTPGRAFPSLAPIPAHEGRLLSFDLPIGPAPTELVVEEVGQE